MSDCTETYWFEVRGCFHETMQASHTNCHVLLTNFIWSSESLISRLNHGPTVQPPVTGSPSSPTSYPSKLDTGQWRRIITRAATTSIENNPRETLGFDPATSRNQDQAHTSTYQRFEKNAVGTELGRISDSRREKCWNRAITTKAAQGR